jgi:hypothetical protein
MPMKTQSVSRATQRAWRTPVESRRSKHTSTNQPDEQSQDLHARISERAYALYEEHGREDSHALEDWLEAEQLILNEDWPARSNFAGLFSRFVYRISQDD